MLRVNLTFDYEVFFHTNHASYDDVLFEPTGQIMDILDKYDIKGIFFIDTLSYFAMEKAGETEYIKKFKNQVIQMFKRGHNPQLHIHGHWLNAEYDKESKTWSNDVTKYRIQDYSKKDIEDSIQNSIDFLNDCAKIAGVEYCCNMFRAGGLILQPDSLLIKILVKHGIKFDSSIAPNCISNNMHAEYNYKNCPKMLNWDFNETSGCCNAVSSMDNCLYEIPVATIRNNPFKYIFLKKPIRTTTKNPLGVGFVRPQNKSNFFKRIIRRFFGYSWVTYDTRSADVILKDIKSIYKKYNCHLNDYTICLIGHPKMTTNLNLTNIESLIIKEKKCKFFALNKKEGN